MKRTHILFLVLLIVISIGGIISSCNEMSGKKQFSETEINAVQKALEGLDESSYLIVLPEIKDSRVIGNKTYGKLPVTEVKRMASAKNVEYSENGNLQAIFQSCSGGGAGSHTESQSAGSEIGKRIEKIMANIDKSQYILMY